MDETAHTLNEVFLEWCPVDELLINNSKMFHSVALKKTLGRGEVYCFFMAAYRPSGYGIVERHQCNDQGHGREGICLATGSSFLLEQVTLIGTG